MKFDRVYIIQVNPMKFCSKSILSYTPSVKLINILGTRYEQFESMKQIFVV